MRILLVEDNPGDARLIREMVAEAPQAPWDIEWVCVDRLSKALDLLSRDTFDTVILDLGLPDSMGIEAVGQVRCCAPAAPIVVLSGVDDERTGLAAVKEGAQDYLIKGRVDSDIVCRALRYAVERKRSEEALRESEKRYRELVDYSLGLMCTHDLGGNLLSVNPAAAELLGYAPQELVGTNLAELIPVRFRGEFADYLVRIRHDGADTGLLCLATKGGHERVVMYRNVLRKEPDRSYVLGHAQDVTERVRLERQLREQSLRDPLTGCYNRRYLKTFEEHRAQGAWGCIMIDIDHFKHYNDTYGHEAGDEALVRISRFLMRHTRAKESVVRMGGDEFLVLLEGADEAVTENVAKRLRSQAAREVPVSFSMGCSARRERERLEKTVDRADKSLLNVRANERSFESKRHS